MVNFIKSRRLTRKGSSGIINKVYTALLFAFLYAPIVVMIIFSFNSSKSTSSWAGFSLKWYFELFHDKQIMGALYYTIIIAVLSSLIATVIGVFAAFGIFHMRKAPQNIMLGINNLPILNPDIVTGISLMTLFILCSGVIRFLNPGFVTLLISHITFNIPYVILAVLPKLKQLNPDTLDAALDLGATPRYAFRKVIIPEIMPGIVTGMLIAFTMSIDDFVISFFVTGNGVSNLSITVYAMAKRGIKPIINALSTLMFLSVLVLMFIINMRSTRDDDRKYMQG